jgi:hypothetical protein
MRVDVTAWTKLAALSTAVALALAITGCGGTQQTDDTPSQETTESATPSAPVTETVVETGTAGLVTTGEAMATQLGDWTVSVRDSEFGSGNDDVTVPSGMQRLKVEVDLTNTSDGELSVSPSDWSLYFADQAFEVLPSSDPDKQGERTLSPGDAEDVTVNFAVPSTDGLYILRFEPAEGGPGAIEVQLQ